MNKLIWLLVTPLLITTAVMAQTVHHIPFASSGNTIELAIENSSTTPASSVSVELKSIPSWLKFSGVRQVIQKIDPQTARSVLFIFAVEKFTPVNRPIPLQFEIRTQDGQTWTKTITLSVSPPETFELSQNYPNPFNPATTITFQLPEDARVSLKIFNLLGQEVATLIDGEKQAGYHAQAWNANAFASGMYIYQLISNDDRGSRTLSRKTMLLVK